MKNKFLLLCVLFFALLNITIASDSFATKIIRSYELGQLYCPSNYSSEQIKFLNTHFSNPTPWQIPGCNYSLNKTQISLLSSSFTEQLKTTKSKPNATNNYQLSLFYLLGIGTKVNIPKAKHYLDLSIAQNNPKAMTRRATLFYLQPISSQQTAINSAHKLLQKAATLGYSNAQIQISAQYTLLHDYTPALYWAKKAYSQNDLNIAPLFANFYLNGTQLKASTTKAISLLKQAIHTKQTSIITKANCYFLLGSIYYDEHNHHALKYLQTAKMLGSSQAFILLSKIQTK